MLKTVAVLAAVVVTSALQLEADNISEEDQAVFNKFLDQDPHHNADTNENADLLPLETG